MTRRNYPLAGASVNGIRLLVAGLLACSTAPEPAPPSAVPAGVRSAASTTAAPTPGAALSTPAVESAEPKTPAPVAVAPFERVRASAAPTVALGNKGRAAVLHDEPWLFDGKDWKRIALPARHKPPAGATDEVQIWFGRDNKPRIMGTRTTTAGREIVYLRYRHGWQNGDKEIGHLANPPKEGLFGVLGWDDPEVVCKIGSICIIKRLTGWTIMKAWSHAPHVVIGQESAWALHDDHIATLGKKAWKKMAAIPFTSPRGLWAAKDMALWVSAGENLYRFDGAAWRKHASPVKAPRALWGSAADDVWVAGEDGAGHFDGKSWRKVAGLKGPLAHAIGREGEVWLSGGSGVWRAKR